MRIKLQEINIDFFSNQILLKSIDYLTMPKDLKLEDITYQKELLIIITSSSMEKNFYDQSIDSYIKRYEEIGKLTTRQVEDYWILIRL